MRHYIIILLLPFTIFQSVSQDLEGFYTSKKGDSLWFYPNNNIEFKLVKEDGLGGRYVIGEGSYKIRKSKIIINSTGHPKKYESSVKRIKYIPNIPPPNTNTFTILDTDNTPIEGASIYYNIKPCRFVGVTSDGDGRAELTINEIIDTDIWIEFLGYIPATISTTDGDSEYLVKLTKDHISFADQAKILVKYSIINDYVLDIEMKKYKKRRKCNRL